MFNNGNACVLFLLGASYTGTLALIFLLRTSGNVSLFGLKKIRSKIRRIGNNRVKISSRIKNLETMGQKISGVNELDGCSSAIWYPLELLKNLLVEKSPPPGNTITWSTARNLQLYIWESSLILAADARILWEPCSFSLLLSWQDVSTCAKSIPWGYIWPPVWRHLCTMRECLERVSCVRTSFCWCGHYQPVNGGWKHRFLWKWKALNKHSHSQNSTHSAVLWEGSTKMEERGHICNQMTMQVDTLILSRWRWGYWSQCASPGG